MIKIFSFFGIICASNAFIQNIKPFSKGGINKLRQIQVSSRNASQLSSLISEISVSDQEKIPVKVIQVDPYSYDTEDDQIMQVASYRNNRMSPELMIESQQVRKDSYDSTQSAIEGVGIGIGIGVVAGIGTYFSNPAAPDALMQAVQMFGVIGVTTGGLLGFNNLNGNRVYVMSMKEARNRLTVDFVASLKIGQDIGFACYIDDNDKLKDVFDGRYVGCNGIVGTVDCQLRNSKFSDQYASLPGSVAPKDFPGLPPHIYMKNMDVDIEMRRRGIGKMLIESVKNWAKTTDVVLLTLEVQDTNEAAVKLYESCGFVKDDSWKVQPGRSLMKMDL